MKRKQAKDLLVGDECYLVSPYCKSKILKVTEVLRTIDGNKYKVRFNDGSFCIIYYNVSCMAWEWRDGVELFLEKEPAIHRLENFAHFISESIKELRNELI